jgi:hypothetical protein
VLAGGCGELGMSAMVLVRAADIDGVDVVACDDILDRPEYRDVVVSRVRCGPFDRVRADRDDLMT